MRRTLAAIVLTLGLVVGVTATDTPPAEANPPGPCAGTWSDYTSSGVKRVKWRRTSSYSSCGQLTATVLYYSNGSSCTGALTWAADTVLLRASTQYHSAPSQARSWQAIYSNGGGTGCRTNAWPLTA